MDVHYLDITGYTCPLTFAKVKIALSKMEKGERLEVLLNEGPPLINVPKSSTAHGHKIISITPVQNTVHKVVIEK